jgi:hypothetical protein
MLSSEFHQQAHSAGWNRLGRLTLAAWDVLVLYHHLASNLNVSVRDTRVSLLRPSFPRHVRKAYANVLGEKCFFTRCQCGYQHIDSPNSLLGPPTATIRLPSNISTATNLQLRKIAVGVQNVFILCSKTDQKSLVAWREVWDNDEKASGVIDCNSNFLTVQLSRSCTGNWYPLNGLKIEFPVVHHIC